MGYGVLGSLTPLVPLSVNRRGGNKKEGEALLNTLGSVVFARSGSDEVRLWRRVGSKSPVVSVLQMKDGMALATF